MNFRLRVTGLLVTAALALPVAVRADTQTTPHHPHKVKKDPPLPPPLPSGTRGPVPQVPLDAIPAVAPEVTFQNGLLTIVAPNSTLGDILRSVRKYTSAEIEIPSTASERVVTRLGPAPAREVMAELLNGSRFNYILLGSPDDSNALVKVVLVAKSGPESAPIPNATPAPGAALAPTPGIPATQVETAEPAEEAAPEESAEQAAAEAEQQQQPPDQPKSPQAMLQEMQQRQLLMQQQGGQPAGYPQPTINMPAPHQPDPQNQ
jgi:hypothetical protein